VYKQEIPLKINIHPVFHDQQLEPYRIPADQTRRTKPSEEEEIEGA
jgi:hypothetical protein